MSNTGTAYAQSFLMHRNALTNLLENIPADQGEFKAWDGGMSFRALTDHLRGSSERANAMLRGQKPEKPEPSADLSTAIERLRETTSSLSGLLDSLSDETLARVIPAFGGREMPVSSLVDFIIAHEAHHKGQIWMMARMIGIEPPMFVTMY
jgi:uncharacterized damage-inducible protein DinB